MKSRKAEISTEMIIGIIIIIITFGIIAIVMVQVLNTTDMDKDLCSLSATARGALPDGAYGSQTKDIAPLKCKTKNICVTTKSSGKGNCSGELGVDFVTYRIKTKNPSKLNKEQKIEEQKNLEGNISMVLAREMSDCWNMLGKGAYSIFARDFKTNTNLGASVVICSKVHFDETITGAEEGQWNLQEISNFSLYLLSHKVPGQKISYWDYLKNAYDGETMSILSGNMVSGKDNNFSNFLNAPLKISTTKAITYMEVRPSAAGAVIGAIGGGIVGITGAIVAKGAFASYIVGGSIAGGSMLGDWIQLSDLKSRGAFSDGTSAAGTFLIDYSIEGFQSIKPELKGKIYEITIESYSG